MKFQNSKYLLSAVIGIVVFLAVISVPYVYAQNPVNDWFMAGANPQRTGWVPAEVRGGLNVQWYRPIEPYILPKIHIVVSSGKIYLSTASGLYAIDAASGNTAWVYPTALPLGHSPTVVDGVAYVGGFDHTLHAVNAVNGQGLWKYEAGLGFETNPLVVNGIVYLGNRDGYFYAIGAQGSAQQGQLIWRYKTDGPILYSAAYKDGVLFFASNDSYAYALNAQTGALVWKSQKLPGSGFSSYWPVVYQDWVIFAGSINYRASNEPFGGHFANAIERADIFPNSASDPDGTLVGTLGAEPGNWAPGTPTVNMGMPDTANSLTTSVTEYFEDDGVINLNRKDHKPWRRSYFVLNRLNGTEMTMDSDNDGNPEYAPILWFDTKSGGNRQPPIIGGDEVLYQTNTYFSNPSIPGGHVSGWKLGTPFISIITGDWGAVDEPHAYSGGGNLIYWKLMGDRQAGVIDLTIPYSTLIPYYQGGGRRSYPSGPQESLFVNYNLDTLAPGYNDMTNFDNGVYGSREGSYGKSGDQSPPVPYNGRVYMLFGNTLFSYAPSYTGAAVKLSLAARPSVPPVTLQVPPVSELKNKLEASVLAIVQAGHLRPGYMSSGILDVELSKACGDNLQDYWSNPSDTVYFLIRALPHLSSSLQTQVRTYLQNEYAQYPLSSVNHVGWQAGISREQFLLPPDVDASRATLPPTASRLQYMWKTNPFAFYGMFKYAELFGGAEQILSQALTQKKLMESFNSVPPDATLIEMPHAFNAYISGYIGYLELERLAGRTESSAIRETRDRLLALRASTFTHILPDSYFTVQKRYCRALSSSRNFMYVVPELAVYLKDHIPKPVFDAAVSALTAVHPYWFVSRASAEYGEGKLRNLYEQHSLFQAKAKIMGAGYEELARYLDAPAFMLGDLFYIDNLVSTIEAASGGENLTGDMNHDGYLNGYDYNMLTAMYGAENCDSNLAGECTINYEDLMVLIQAL